MEEFDLMRLLLLLLLRNRGAAVFASDLDPQANCCIKIRIVQPQKNRKNEYRIVDQAVNSCKMDDPQV
jgi:hypothetical protein